jgi:hypothetical protein
MMIARRAAVLALLVLAAAGCDGRAPALTAPAAPASTENPREEAPLLASRGDYVGAETKYRAALAAEPDDVPLHFGRGSVLTQLDRRDEAIEEFRWVVTHGRPGRPEVDGARAWLAQAGIGAPAPATVAAAAADPQSAGQLVGSLTWPDVPAAKNFGIRVVVERADGGERKTVRSKLNGTYAIDGLADGAYKVTGLAGPVRVWSDLPVTVAAGRPTTFDLTPANASVSPAEFPVRGAAQHQ